MSEIAPLSGVRADTPRRSQRLTFVSAVLSNGGARVLTAITPFLTVPIVARSLGREGYGAYVVVSSVATLLPVLEFGLGLSLVSALSRTDESDHVGRRRYTSSAFFLLALLAGAILVVTLAITPFVNWSSLLGVNGVVEPGQTELAVLTVIVAFCIALPANLIQKVALGVGRSTAPALWQLLAAPVIVAAALMVGAFRPTLVNFIAAVYVTPALVGIAVAFYQWRKRHADLRPRVRDVSRESSLSLARLGLAFLVTSLAVAVAFQTDTLVLSHILGVEKAATYSVAYRISAVAMIVGQGLCLPLWPYFGQLTRDGDVYRLRRVYAIATGFAISGGLLFAVSYLLFGRTLIRVWVGSDFQPTQGVLWAMSCLAFVQVLQLPANVYFAAAGHRRMLTATAVSMAILNLPLSIILTHRLGQSGPAWSSVVAVTACMLLPSLVYLTRILNVHRSAPALEGGSAEGGARMA